MAHGASRDDHGAGVQPDPRMRALILVDTFGGLEYNHIAFGRALSEAGWNVAFGLVNSVSMVNGAVYSDIATGTFGDEFEIAEQGTESVEGWQLTWVMNQPHPEVARDVWQVLWNLGKRSWFVNSVEGLTFLNNKTNLGLIVPADHLPVSYVSNQFSDLWSRVCMSDGSWVAKPTNAGAGADVFLVNPADSNARVILQSMTGNVEARNEVMDAELCGLANRYCVLQEYVPTARQGVKRVLVAGGEVVASYCRVPAGDHRSNYTHGGRLVSVGELTSDELSLSEDLARRLLDNGICFGGIDMAYPYVLEVNLVNPGGLVNVQDGGHQRVAGVLDLILQQRAV